MAFNRSNSLSINTGATNSLFSQQNSNAGTTSLFGGTSNQNQAQPSGGLFGNTNNQNPSSTSGGLFGNTNTQSQPQQTGGLFGGAANTQSQPAQTGGLFGTTNTNNQNTTAGSSSLFGGGNNNNTSNTSGGLFGGAQNNTPTTSGGLFGGAQNNTSNTGTMFGNTSNKPAGSLFGGGGLGGSTQPNAAPSMFSQSNNNPSGSTFGIGSTSRQPPQPTAPSLLGATQHAQMNNSAPFGRLSMGQSTAGSQPTVGAVKIDLDTMRPTTRFEDLNDTVKADLENIDKLIQLQESYARQIEAFIPKHEENVNFVAPDVDFIKNKVEDVEQALAFDALGVESQRKNTDKDVKDAGRVDRVIANLSLPQSYQYPNISMSGYGSAYGQQRPQQAPTNVEGDDPSNYDTDLISNYFTPMTNDLQNLMAAYANNLAEIEAHLRVIESSAVGQSQQLAMRQAGINGNPQTSSDDTVRELADTLRGFESSILGVAGVVGECREGVNQLILGRLGNILR